MSNRLRRLTPTPGTTRLGQQIPVNRGTAPSSAFTPYGQSPVLLTGGEGSAPATFIPSAQAGTPQMPGNFYPGGTPVADADDLAALRDLHNHMQIFDPLSARPLTDDEVDVLQDHAGTGCAVCAAYLSGARRGAAGVKVRFARQAAAEAAVRQRRS